MESHLFVTGAPRSGTTLLRNLLIAHSALIGTDRESSGLFRFRDFSKFKIGELSNDEWMSLLNQSQGLPELYDRLAKVFIHLKGGLRFVDKINITSWRLQYMKRYFPNAGYVNIIRDGRDSLCSARCHPNVRQSQSIGKYAIYWSKCAMLPCNVLPSERLYNIRYEDLVSNPAEEIRRLMQFVGFEFEDQQVSVQHYSKVSSLKKIEVHQNLDKPINTSSVGRWKHELSKCEQQEFSAVAGDALKTWGYEI